MRIPRTCTLPTIEEVPDFHVVYPRTPYPTFEPVRQRSTSISSEDSLTGLLSVNRATPSDPEDLALSDQTEDESCESNDVSSASTEDDDDDDDFSNPESACEPKQHSLPPGADQSGKRTQLAVPDLLNSPLSTGSTVKQQLNPTKTGLKRECDTEEGRA